MSLNWPGGLPRAEYPAQGQCCVYLLRNTINGMKYVGVSWSLRRRIKDHKKKTGPTRSYIRNAINQYGIEAFELSVLHLGERRDCLEREKQFIEEHGSLVPAGYNICGGGQGSVAAITGERNYWYGKKLSEEHKAAMSRANKGKTLTPEHRKKIAETNRQRWEERRASGLVPAVKQRAHKNTSHSLVMQQRWQDPEFRAKMCAIRKTQKKFEGKKPCLASPAI